ncbi:rod shape-determining protein MreC [Aurantivibrio infirmus]
MKPLFAKNSSLASRAVVLGLIALLLVLINSYTSWLDPIRAKLNIVSTPFYWLTDLPSRIGEWGEDGLGSRQNLLEENKALKDELLIHKAKNQKMASVLADNVRLQRLMNSSETIRERVVVADIVGLSPDPLAHKIVINKGSQHDVYVGQPLLDADGLMGQVVAVYPYTSDVLLITDSSHAIPVQVNRNGVRAVAEGVGDLYTLTLRHVSNTVDIREGDLLVSSGLGQRFPVGYPVATVESVIHDPGQPFATVIARPAAQLNRSRPALLVFSREEPSSVLPDSALPDSALPETD